METHKVYLSSETLTTLFNYVIREEEKKIEYCGSFMFKDNLLEEEKAFRNINDTKDDEKYYGDELIIDPDSFKTGDAKGGRLLCEYKKYTNYIWHTHPEKSIPSVEDILKVAKKEKTDNNNNNKIRNSSIFSVWGVWQIYRIDGYDIYDEDNLLKSIDLINGNILKYFYNYNNGKKDEGSLYKYSRKYIFNKDKINEEYNQIIKRETNKYINAVNKLLKGHVKLEIKFWDEIFKEMDEGNEINIKY